MDVFETTATVEDHGQLHVGGVPFAPGTEVEVMIIPKSRIPDEITASDEQARTDAARRAAQLLAALDKARNTTPIGALRREELYDRKVLR